MRKSYEISLKNMKHILDRHVFLNKSNKELLIAVAKFPASTDRLNITGPLFTSFICMLIKS